MWDCPHCGCMNILVQGFCPMCFKPRDVAAEPGQPPEAPDGSPVGSKTSKGNSSPSEDDSGAAPSSPSSKKTKNDPDWGKE